MIEDALPSNGSTYFYHLDPLGSVERLTDANGATAVEYRYDSKGRTVQVTTGPAWDASLSENPYRWAARAGATYDEATGLYDVLGATYDPELGRPISKHRAWTGTAPRSTSTTARTRTEEYDDVSAGPRLTHFPLTLRIPKGLTACKITLGESGRPPPAGWKPCPESVLPSVVGAPPPSVRLIPGGPLPGPRCYMEPRG